MSFDPTYKGWKLQYDELVLGRSFGFDPTYKGWKHDLKNLLQMNQQALILPTRDGNKCHLQDQCLLLTRFDPTYKGWKPCQVLCF